MPLDDSDVIKTCTETVRYKQKVLHCSIVDPARHNHRTTTTTTSTISPLAIIFSSEFCSTPVASKVFRTREGVAPTAFVLRRWSGSFEAANRQKNQAHLTLDCFRLFLACRTILFKLGRDNKFKFILPAHQAQLKRTD